MSNSYPRFLGAIHKECPHIRGRGGSGKSGQMPNVDVRLEINYSYYICEIYSDNLVVCLYMMSCLCHACLTFTSWSTPSFGMLLWKLFFLPFSVNCSQVAMFQIMPALCPHGQGEVGWSTKCGQAWTWGGGGGSQKFPNLCGHPLWMTPYNNASFQS